MNLLAFHVGEEPPYTFPDRVYDRTVKSEHPSHCAAAVLEANSLIRVLLVDQIYTGLLPTKVVAADRFFFLPRGLGL